MATTEELTARREALEEAMHSGVLTVRHGEVTTTFRSIAEIEKAIASLNRKIAGKRRSPAVGRQDDRGY